MPRNTETSQEALRGAIRDLHGCESRWTGSRPVTETFRGEVAWQGQVEVFDLIDHPAAERAYAWAHGTDEGRTRYVAVLHEGPVDSAQAAVRAAIVAEHQERDDAAT